MRCDLDLLRHLIEDGVIGAAMAELQLVRLTAQRQPQDLMPQTDSEDRLFPDQSPDLFRLVLKRLGIARTVREKNTIGLESQHVLGRCARRNHSDTRTHLYEPSENVALDPEIVGDDVAAWVRGGRKLV